MGVVDNIDKLVVDLSPLAATVNCIIEVLDALFDIPLEHVIHVNLGFTSLNDLVADLIEQSRNALIGAVKLAVVPNHSHSL